MEKQPPHRPERSFPNAKRLIVECELEVCIHCGRALVPRKPWHMRKTVQTLAGPLFVAGKSKKCDNPQCLHGGQHYYASGAWKISLPYSSYGLDVLAYIGWQHEKEHRQLVEIQQDLNGRGILVSERTVGRVYRQFLALLGGAREKTLQELEATAKEQGGLVWAIDALKPEGHGTLLYVLYEALKGTPVSALQSDHPTADELSEWLKPYRGLPYEALATLSDGEEAIIAALKQCWPNAPHQRCQEHALGNIVEPVLKHDTHLRQQMHQDLGRLPAVPEQTEEARGPVDEDEALARGVPIAERVESVVPGMPQGEASPWVKQVPTAERVELVAAGRPVSTGQAKLAPPFCRPSGMLN